MVRSSILYESVINRYDELPHQRHIRRALAIVAIH
jgi:hypothetical protein